MARWGGRRVARITAVLLQRDYIPGKGWRCYLCRRITNDAKLLSVEHKTPRSQGGTDAMSNLVLAHRSCNYARGAKPVDEFQAGIVDRTAWITSLPH